MLRSGSEDEDSVFILVLILISIFFLENKVDSWGGFFRGVISRIVYRRSNCVYYIIFFGNFWFLSNSIINGNFKFFIDCVF